MLNTAKLLNAKMNASQNEILKTLFGLVQLYNASESQPATERIYILERILVGAAEWLTSKRPKNTGTNQARWKALDDLAKQVVDEGARLGARFLTGPTDWKQITGQHANQSYWLEYLAPQHRVGYRLSDKFDSWLSSGGPADETFWEWLAINPPYGDEFVKYYGGTAKAEKRRVLFKEDGKLYRSIDDSVFDTRALKTHASGNGWAIFVVSPEGKMYSHKHEVGVYHHSTFLSGSAVMAAGEIVVDTGVVKFITAKSGHYRPTPDNLRNFVTRFPQIPRTAIVIPSFSGTPLAAYSVGEFKFNRTSPKSLKQAQVKAALPAWALGPDAQVMVNKIAV